MTADPAGDPCVLVCDDDEGVRSTVAEILRRAGYRVLEAQDGEMALEMLGQEHVSALILDIRMPRRDGVALLDALESPPAVLLVSAFSVEPAVRARIGPKVFRYLRKPVQPERLLDILAAAVHGEVAS